MMLLFMKKSLILCIRYAYQPPPTSTSRPQTFLMRSSGASQVFQAFLYVRFSRFKRFFSRRLPTEC
jgi:hypothetical protein